MFQIVRGNGIWLIYEDGQPIGQSQTAEGAKRQVERWESAGASVTVSSTQPE